MAIQASVGSAAGCSFELDLVTWPWRFYGTVDNGHDPRHGYPGLCRSTVNNHENEARDPQGHMGNDGAIDTIPDQGGAPRRWQL
jgi:hypothetical protein